MAPREARTISSYSKFYVACDDYCIVTYTLDEDSKYLRGKPKYSVYYRGKVFLMADEEKTLKFLKTPEPFYQKYLRFKPPPKEYIDWDEKSMLLNFKELTPKLLTSALLELHKCRPKHYMFSTTLSASMFLGIFFKMQTKNIEEYEIWKYLSEQYREECKIIFWILRRFQANVNPFMRIEDETEVEARKRLSSLELL
uniref:Uncharacterized protein n=1 Tax=Megaselia scalaris TaxID=36166 RepID=T1GWU1_MEGSC